MKETKERLMSLLYSIRKSKTIMGGEFHLVHDDHIHILEDIIEYISKLEKSEEAETSSDEDKIKQLLKKIHKGERKSYVVMTPEEMAISGNRFDLMAMVDCVIEQLAKNMEISKKELCKLLF